MHSSNMRTGRTLTVFRGEPPENLEEPPENLEEPPKKDPPPVDRITDACKKHNLGQKLRFGQ